MILKKPYCINCCRSDGAALGTRAGVPRAARKPHSHPRPRRLLHLRRQPSAIVQGKALLTARSFSLYTIVNKIFGIM